MRIFKHLRTDWFRYGFETLAVIVGILSAFALESWRDSLRVQKEEHEILMDLYNDLLHAKEQSEALIHEELKTMDLLVSALGLSSNMDSLPQEFYSDSTFYNLIWNVEMDVPVINSYSDLKNTGNTGLISNEEIRRNFTNLELGITHVTFQVDDRLKVQQMRIDELAVTNLNFLRMIHTTMPEINTDHEPENNYRLLLENQKTRNLLAIKLNLSNSVLGYRRELDAEIQRLIALLEIEIEN
jgi:hypothetical protein